MKPTINFLACGLAVALLTTGALAKDFTTLHAFSGGKKDGARPLSNVILDAAGNAYGTTNGGGKNCEDQGVGGCGTVFKISPHGTETVLYNFCSQTNCADGSGPQAGLISDGSGNLYGTTYAGGSSSGGGTVFKLAPGGTLTVLHAFGGGADGCAPDDVLIADASGNVYGTTIGDCDSDNGTVFEVAPGGTETVLHHFTGGSDGTRPFASVLADASGNLYGTTYGGGNYTDGSYCQFLGCGIVFKLSPDGTETVLHTFCKQPSCSDGGTPAAGLIADSNGNLYGTTTGGGKGCDKNGCGTIFKLTPMNNGYMETVLYTFTGKGSDGAYPGWGDLVMDAEGNLYGTTSVGGGKKGCSKSLDGCGTVFELAPDGSLTTLHSFSGRSDGANPNKGLLLLDGELYGTANLGANLDGKCAQNGCGTVFKLKF
jgi:uncharacterized repeat protein (TIGR03803 family)